MKKIEKLSEAQEVRMQSVLKEWLEVGRSAHSCNRKEAEKSIIAMYDRIGKKAPVFFWMPSPLQCMLGIAVSKVMLSDKDNLGANLRANLRDNLWANLRPNLGANLRDNLGANLRDNLEDNLRDNLGDNLEANLRDNLEANLGDNLEYNLRDNLGANLGANLGDNLWANLWANLEANLRDNLRANLEDNLENNLGDNLRANLGANLRANLGDNLRDNLGANLGDNLWDNLRANLGDNLRANLGANLGDNLRDNLWANLGDNLRANLGANLRDNLEDNLEWNYFAGNLWCGWEVFYDFCGEIGVPYSAQDRHDLDLWLNQSRHCHLWWPMENTVFISERPESVRVDNNGRLHNETDAAMHYHDGYALYYWHGVKTPKWIITEPDKITIENIEAENNAEIRRIMISKYGMAKYLEESGAKEIDRDRDTKGERILYSKNDKMGIIKMIKLENSTPEPDGSAKYYTFRVDPKVSTCQEAVSYLYSRDPKQYRPQVES